MIVLQSRAYDGPQKSVNVHRRSWRSCRRRACGSRAAILSSIEFDRDAPVFATAGVSKRISMYDFAAVLATPVLGVTARRCELVTRSKLCCLSWNK